MLDHELTKFRKKMKQQECFLLNNATKPRGKKPRKDKMEKSWQLRKEFKRESRIAINKSSTKVCKELEDISVASELCKVLSNDPSTQDFLVIPYGKLKENS